MQAFSSHANGVYAQARVTAPDVAMTIVMDTTELDRRVHC